MDKQSYRSLTQSEIEALVAFRDAYGRGWKAKLNEVYWYNARIWRGPKEDMGYILHSLRNSHGPTWLLDHCKLPKGTYADIVEVCNAAFNSAP